MANDACPCCGGVLQVHNTRPAIDGDALAVTFAYADAPAPINPFIHKYNFPGADLPSLSEVFAAVERSGLIVTDVGILRLHYAETVRHWRERIIANRRRIAALYDERFCRMWKLASASAP